MEHYHSQFEQDRWVHGTFFEQLRECGVFVDVGANDGVTFSNSLFFERELGWSGLCVEPLPETFSRLAANRRCTCVEAACGVQDGTAELLIGASEMLSGLVDVMSSHHRDRIEREGGRAGTVTVKVVNLGQLLLRQGITTIHYLSMDIEGGEAAVLATLPKSIFVHVATIEANDWPSARAVIRHARQLDLALYGKLGSDLVFVNWRSPYLPTGVLPRLLGLQCRDLLTRLAVAFALSSRASAFKKHLPTVVWLAAKRLLHAA